MTRMPRPAPAPALLAAAAALAVAPAVASARKSPLLDQFLDAGRTTLDLGQRRGIYAQVQRHTAEELPYIFLWHPTELAVARETVRGFKLTPAGDFTPLREVWLAQ